MNNYLSTVAVEFLLALCCFIGGLQQIAAQPRVTASPRNASVLLGQDAQFTVSASGTAPLAYQWRLDGRELAGATNPNLTVANVALSNLGRYDVVVSNNTGEVTSAPASLLLARWTELVAFGRSDAQAAPSACGRLTWPGHLANNLGVPVRIYAPVPFTVGVPSALIQTQITRYLNGSLLTTNTLIALWNGGIDLVRGVSVEQSVANHLALVRRLADAGARHLLLPAYWPPEVNPEFVATNPHMTSELVMQFNAQVKEGLKALQTQYPLTIYQPDMFAFIQTLSENLADSGFREPLGSDFTCDGFHFTDAVHRLNAQEMYRSLTSPVMIDSGVRTPSGDVVLNWSGGSPPFRIDRTTELLSGHWEAVGEPTFLSSGAMKPASPQEFFRVVRLGQ